MDASRFDTLTRRLAARPRSRRRLLRALTGGALTAALSRLGPAAAAEQIAARQRCKLAGQRCSRDRDCCHRRCKRGTCTCPKTTTRCGKHCCPAGTDCDTDLLQCRTVSSNICPAGADTCRGVMVRCESKGDATPRHCYQSIEGTPFCSYGPTLTPTGCTTTADCTVPGSKCVKARQSGCTCGTDLPGCCFQDCN